MVPITIGKSNCLSSFVDKFLPTPGLYFGTYSAHGWEIIDVHFNDNDQFLEGIKITVGNVFFIMEFFKNGLIF